MSKMRPWESEFIRGLSRVTQLVQAGAGGTSSRLIAPSSHCTPRPGHPDGLGNAVAGRLLGLGPSPVVPLPLKVVSLNPLGVALRRSLFLTELKAPCSLCRPLHWSSGTWILKPSADKSAALPVG